MFPESMSVSVEQKSGMGALFSIITILLTVPYGIGKFLQFRDKTGTTITMETEAFYFSEQEPFRFVAGSADNDYEYPFRLAIGVSDTKTGEYPTDLDRVGEIRIDIWDFHQDLQNTGKAITDSLEELRTHPCTPSYL